MLAEWNRGQGLIGPNLIAESRMENGIGPWILEQHEAARGKLSVAPIAADPAAPQGNALLASDLQPDSTPWHLQLTCHGLDLKEGQPYTLSFAAKAQQKRSIHPGLGPDQRWSGIGLDAAADLGTHWKRFSFSFVAKGTVANHNRIAMQIGNAGAVLSLVDFRFARLAAHRASRGPEPGEGFHRTSRRGK